MLTKAQVRIILILLDNKGHAQWELADYLEMQDSNLSPILKKLAKSGIIFQGNARISNKKRKKEGDYKEFPYYLANNLDGFRSMIREMARSDKVFETGFILEIIRRSKYIKSMREIIGKKLDKCMDKEIRENYPPFKDKFFTGVIEPLLGVKIHYSICEAESDSLEDVLESKLVREMGRPRNRSWRNECLLILSNFEIISE